MTGILPASLGLIRSEALRKSEATKDSPVPLPFVTIAREVGAGGDALASALAEQLSEGAEVAWRAYDRELVEKIAADHKLSQTLIDLLEDTSHNWLQQMFEELDFSRPSTDALTHRVIQTVRSLAEVGHVILVGRGGVYITQNMPNGVHVSLVAPFEDRVDRYAHRLELSKVEARRRVTEIDKNRAAFYAHYFPKYHGSSSVFDLTINTSRVSHESLVELVAMRVAEVSRHSRGVKTHNV